MGDYIPEVFLFPAGKTFSKSEITKVTLIAAFHTQRSGNYSICLSGQKSETTILAMKINKVLRPFSTATEKTICQ